MSGSAKEKGSILLEVLVSIFIFGFGILTIIFFNTKVVSANTEITIRDKTFNIAQEYINSLNYNQLFDVCCTLQSYPCPAANIPIPFQAETANLCQSNPTAVITFNLINIPPQSKNCGGICLNGEAQGTVNIKWKYKGDWQSYTNYISNMEFQ